MFVREKYFNVFIEFDKCLVDSIIDETIKTGKKGFVCSIESNNLSVANQDPYFENVVNSSLVNICDGSVLAIILGLIYKKNLKTYIGADLFIEYISKKKYKQFFIGNTPKVLEGLKRNLSKIDSRIENMNFETLPFSKVDDFDYKGIAEMINSANPDIIWVSLGAPKQEIFMQKLLPYLNKGVMFGFGAIFNFYAGSGKIRRAPKFMRRMKLEWFYRACQEPKKNVPRYWNFLVMLPKLIKEEKAKVISK